MGSNCNSPKPRLMRSALLLIPFTFGCCDQGLRAWVLELRALGHKLWGEGLRIWGLGVLGLKSQQKFIAHFCGKRRGHGSGARAFGSKLKLDEGYLWLWPSPLLLLLIITTMIVSSNMNTVMTISIRSANTGFRIGWRSCQSSLASFVGLDTADPTWYGQCQVNSPNQTEPIVPLK